MKILFLTSRFPYPLEKGDKLRAYNQIKELSQHHQVILYAITENKIEYKWENEISRITYFYKYTHLTTIRKYINIIRGFFNILPFQVNYFFNKRKKKEIEKLIVKFNPEIIFCQLIRMSEYIKDLENIKVLDYMDAFSKGVQRRMEQQPFYLKSAYKIEFNRLLKYEGGIFDSFDASVIISTADREQINIKQKEKIQIIQNGVNFDYFKPRPEVKKEFDIVFTGNMSYAPNVTAVLFLHNEILPLLKPKYPHLKILIAGANPSPKVKELNDPQFVITGWVEDINECYAKSKIFVAPMFIGTGLQNKLLEAMAVQLPCITSPLVNNSLGALKNRDILIAGSAIEYANYIEKLLSEPSYAAEIAEAGNKFVKQNFSWGKTTDQLVQIFEELIEA